MTAFAVAFAAEFKGFMKSNGVTGAQIAEVLGRGEGYVSERTNGKRALDTNDVDALAELAGKGWTGKTLMIELARRTRLASRGGELIEVQFTRVDDQSGLEAASERENEPDSDEGFEGGA